jgi:hypothetical protein
MAVRVPLYENDIIINHHPYVKVFTNTWTPHGIGLCLRHQHAMRGIFFTAQHFKEFFLTVTRDGARTNPIYTHTHTHTHTHRLAFSVRILFGRHLCVCVFTRSLTRIYTRVPAYILYRYCIVGTWSRTWSPGLRWCVCVCVRVCACARALVCVDGREKGRPHSRAGSLPPKPRRNVVGS